MKIDSVAINDQFYGVTSLMTVHPYYGKTWKYSLVIGGEKYDLSSKVDEDIATVLGKDLEIILVSEIKEDILQIINRRS